jgi:DNA mismatch repair protein MutS2
LADKSSIAALELDRILALVALEAKTSIGKNVIAARRPMKNIAAVENAHADLSEMVRFYQSEGQLPLSGLTDVAALFVRETILELDESWLIVRSLRATQSVRETFVRSDRYPRLKKIAENITDAGALLTKLNKFFTRDGKLREDASTELRSIRQRVQQKRTAIQKTLNDVMNRNADAMQDQLIVMRGDRYCVPVRTEHRNAIGGILHERSGSGASVFIEPMAAIELNNDLAELLIHEREEIARITREVSLLLFDSRDDIRIATEISGDLDALQASAIFADTTQSTRPSFNNDHILHLIDARHPLLDERLASARADAFGEAPSDRRVVPVSVSLNRETTALVVSGPNAGGKTIALKTSGVIVAMAMSGLPVPAADGTNIPIVDDIHVLIGDDQSVLEHLSTFSAYLVRLKRVLERVTNRSLVLLDELGSGTDPEEGAALAASTVEFLLEKSALLMVTTHLSSLKTFAVNDARIVNASMEFNSASGQPTYRMIIGLPGRSRAIEVAEMIGLPSSITQQARARLGDRFGETDQLLAQLQKAMSDVLAERDAATQLRQEIENERAILAAKQEALDKERGKAGLSFREELERLKDDVARQVAAEIKQIRESSRTNVNAREVVATLMKPVEKAIEFIPAEEREVHVGDRAEHRKFKITGEVVSIAGGKAILSVSGKKITVDVKDLVPKAGAGSASGQSKLKSGRSSARPASSDVAPVSAELNLIGQRVDDALEESDKFLDRALLEGKQAVRIIHGFGTGALRKALREHLRKHPAVKSWRPGDDNEGGDGATVAVLED